MFPNIVVVPPGPPTDIYISSTSSEANITWKQPLFIGEFFSEIYICTLVYTYVYVGTLLCL